MIVTAMLAWYDEDPAILDRAITSLQGFADRLIACDGRWNHYPGDQPTSPVEQYNAIRHASRKTGLLLDIHGQPARRWTGQVQKRNYMLQHAAPVSDWVMPLDADWELVGDPNEFRFELEHTDADALRMAFYTPINPDRPLYETAATEWHESLAGATMIEPLIYRALKDMRVEDHHWIYTGTDRNGDRVALWGNPGGIPQAKTLNLQAPIHILHHCLYRDQRTIQANRVYCNARAEYVSIHGREP